MKKILLCGLVLLVILAVPAFAEEQSLDDSSLVEYLTEVNAEVLQRILNPEYFDDSMAEIDLQQPMFVVYPIYYPPYAGNTSFEEVLNEAVNHPHAEVVIADDTATRIGVYQATSGEGYRIDVRSPYNSVPTYFRDIINGTVRQPFLGNIYNVNNVYVFEMATLHRGTAVVYETDGGRFVRFYTDKNTPAVEYTWAEYEEFAIAYHAYDISHAYNEKGEPMAGCAPSFVEFAEEYKAQKEAERQAELEAARRKTILYISIGAGAIVLCAATATTLLLRRRKKHQTTEE